MDNQHSDHLTAGSSPGTYVYRPLDTATTIRLLHLNPGKYDDPLTGELYHVELPSNELLHDKSNRATGIDVAGSASSGSSARLFLKSSQQSDNSTSVPIDKLVEEKSKDLDPGLGEGFDHNTDPSKIETPQYETLSYVWGSPQCHQSFICSSGTIAITSNLEVALKRIRLAHHVRVVWADAICINQADTGERGHQVGLMGRIYSEASRVMIWLGPDTNGSAKKVFDAMHRDVRSLADLERDRDYVLRKRVLDVLRGFTQSLWFTRVWVVQEFHLSRAAIFRWGDEQIDGETVGSFIASALLWAHSGLTREFSWMSTSMPKLGLLGTLNTLRHMSCHNDLDRIYSIQGLLSGPEHARIDVQTIKPDYTRSVVELFVEVAIMCVEGGDVSLLLCGVNHSHSPLGASLPSWTPDWTVPLPNMTVPWYKGDTAEVPIILDREKRSLAIVGRPGEPIAFLMGQTLSPEDPSATLDLIASFWRLRVCSHTFDAALRFQHVEMSFLQALSTHIIHDSVGDIWQYTLDLLLYPLNDVAALLSAPYETTGLELLQYLEGRARHNVQKYYGGSDLSYDRASWTGRKLFQTATGYVGLGPGTMAADDILTTFSSVDLPVVLRRVNGGYRFIGIAIAPTFFARENKNKFSSKSTEKVVYKLL